jgi:alanine racemase
MRCWVEISLGRIARNFRAICAAAPGVEIVPVVKANAYGHGMAPVAAALAAEGAHWFAVSSFEEGLALRASGIRARVLVMADTGFDPVRHEGLTPVIHSLGEIPDAPFHLKIDTGMHRLGVLASPEEVIAAVKKRPIEGLMTHFASSADFQNPHTRDQLSCFLPLVEAIAPRYVHAASTNPIHFGIRESWFNMARPGLALYGYLSRARGEAPGHLLSVRPALTWQASVIAVKDVAAGARVGYGGSFVAPRAMRLAIVGAGYADGLSRRLSNKPPFVGAISMDVSTIDISTSPDLRPGDAVALLGDGRSAVDLARQAGTIAYEVLTSISARVHRIYRE